VGWCYSFFYNISLQASDVTDKTKTNTLTKLQPLRNHVFVFKTLRPNCGPRPPRFTRFRDHTQRRATVGRTALDE
jgi:hypothetical protein